MSKALTDRAAYLLEILQQYGDWVSVADMYKLAQLIPKTALRQHLEELVTGEYVYRQYGARSSYRYKFAKPYKSTKRAAALRASTPVELSVIAPVDPSSETDTAIDRGSTLKDATVFATKPPPNRETTPVAERVLLPHPTPNLSPHDVQSLLERWSESPWHPKIFDTARYLPLSLARLYELAVSMRYGTAVKKTELTPIYADLATFRTDLVNTLGVLDAFLEKPDLWDTARFHIFLLDNGVPLERLRDLAFQMKTKN